MTEQTLAVAAPFVWASNDFARRPAAALIYLDEALARRIHELAKLCAEHRLTQVRVEAVFEDIDTVGLPDEFKVVHDAIGDEHLVVAATGSDLERAFRALKAAGEIGGETLVVTDTCWYLTCYGRQSSIDFETATMPLPRLPLNEASLDFVPADGGERAEA